ncbi:flap endonuclease-1 [Candidatus Woesearchaeota archaeon]|nr:flap endonuclease-1 [Candidatus Woesearchaeota archaeon]
MGVQLKDLIISEQVDLKELAGKVLIFDAFNLLYQFITTIRQRDGTPLLDSHGNMTSHLVGISSRIPKLMQLGIKMAFVFDGKPPALKDQERERRRQLRQDAASAYTQAKEAGDEEAMRKYAARGIRLTGSMIEEAKDLLAAFGLPVIQAPSEGEAQAASFVRQGLGYAVVSQDFDCLLFGAPRVIRNLSLTEKKDAPLECVDLSSNLQHLGIDQQQLIALGMLIGTDYNIGGMKGIGPKKGLKLVKEYGQNLPALFQAVHWSDSFSVPWQEVFAEIEHPLLATPSPLLWQPSNPSRIKQILAEHDFGVQHINAICQSCVRPQRALGEFF